MTQDQVLGHDALAVADGVQRDLCTDLNWRAGRTLPAGRPSNRNVVAHIVDLADCVDAKSTALDREFPRQVLGVWINLVGELQRLADAELFIGRGFEPVDFFGIDEQGVKLLLE